MDDRSRLEWVMRNKAPRTRTTSAAAAVDVLVEKVWSGDVEPAEEASAALAEFVDDEFRSHCRVGKWQGGVLTIEVDEFAMVPLMRRTWLSRIRRAWPGLGMKQGLKRINFEQGRAGVPLAR
jgi:hypothetical protein